MEYFRVLLLLTVGFIATTQATSQCPSGYNDTLVEMTKTFEFTAGSSFILGQVIYQNNFFYGLIRYTLSSRQHTMVFKRDQNFANGGEVKYDAISRDSDPASLAAGDSLAIATDSSFLLFSGMINDSSTFNAFLSRIDESTFSITSSYRFSGMKNFHSIVLSQDAVSAFLIGRDGSNNGVLCLVSVSTLNSAD